MTFLSTVDFRKHLSEAVDASQITMLTGNQAVTVEMSAKSDPRRIATSLTKRLKEGMEARRHLYFPQIVAFRHHTVDIMTNNGGILPSLDHPNDVEIINVMPVLVPPNTKNVAPGTPSKVNAALYGFNGRLCVRLACAIGRSKSDNDVFAESFLERLSERYAASIRRYSPM